MSRGITTQTQLALVVRAILQKTLFGAFSGIVKHLNVTKMLSSTGSAIALAAYAIQALSIRLLMAVGIGYSSQDKGYAMGPDVNLAHCTQLPFITRAAVT